MEILDNLHADVEADDANKLDKLCRVEDLVVAKVDGIWQEGRLTSPVADFQLQGRATSQLCSLLGIPASYYKRCPSELQHDQLDYWLERRKHGADEDSHLLMRCRESVPSAGRLQTRAVLTDQYARFDNKDLLDMMDRLLDPLFGRDDLRLVDYGLTDSMLWLRLEASKNGSSQHRPALTVTNSEVGHSALRMVGGLWTMICSNGLWGWSNEVEAARKHTGEVRGLSDWFVSKLPAVLNATRDAMDSILPVMDRAFPLRHDAEPRFVRYAASQIGISLEEASLWLGYRQRHYSEEDTVGSWVESLSAAARESNGPDRMEVERAAGRLMEWLSRDDVRPNEILEDAERWEGRADRRDLPEITMPSMPLEVSMGSDVL